MIQKLLAHRPPQTSWLILALLIGTGLTEFVPAWEAHSMLFPGILQQPAQWYRLLLYPFHVDGLVAWFLLSLGLLLWGVMWEKKLSTAAWKLWLLAAVLGGLGYAWFNQASGNPLVGPVFLFWASLGCALGVGLKYRASLKLVEKVLLGLAFLALGLFLLPNRGGVEILSALILLASGLFGFRAPPKTQA
ncbi:MAG: hypothetical protein AAFR61_13795 [Bacteroidota bacterium]